MPDITMCKGNNCPDKYKETCYRFLAEPSDWQSYFSDDVFDNEKNECEHYWKYKPKNSQPTVKK